MEAQKKVGKRREERRKANRREDKRSGGIGEERKKIGRDSATMRDLMAERERDRKDKRGIIGRSGRATSSLTHNDESQSEITRHEQYNHLMYCHQQ